MNLAVRFNAQQRHGKREFVDAFVRALQKIEFFRRCILLQIRFFIVVAALKNIKFRRNKHKKVTRSFRLLGLSRST